MSLLVASTSRAARPTMARLSPLSIYRGYADNTSTNKINEANKDDNKSDESSFSPFLRATATRIESNERKTTPSAVPKAKAPVVRPSPLRENFVPFSHNRPYNPYDFEPENRLQEAKRFAPNTAGPSRPLAIREDVFHQLDINPLDEVLNSALITHYTTDMGRIKARKDTRLTWKNQRKIGKAIRRARAMGLIPSFSKWNERAIRDL